MTAEHPCFVYLLGPAGSGKTRSIIQNALAAAKTAEESRVIVLVPDQATAMYERTMLVEIESAVLTGITVTGFKRLKHVCRARSFEQKQIADKPLLRALVYRILRTNSESAPLFSGARRSLGVL